ncbi:hypothetical protein AVEN_243493-1 [Araneus ventricosus]|uniref:Uncharacterized protein n=1 Tax=Araneus ventricosus TaxID=182803 RepID=A0A4Y2W7H5_ARAVE|nr:hypothetical protein AVEN_243493-1 [Araneus ventricosus]
MENRFIPKYAGENIYRYRKQYSSCTECKQTGNIHKQPSSALCYLTSFKTVNQPSVATFLHFQSNLKLTQLTQLLLDSQVIPNGSHSTARRLTVYSCTAG